MLLDQGEQALNAAYVRVEQLERDKAELLLQLQQQMLQLEQLERDKAELMLQLLDARAAGASEQQEAREEVLSLLALLVQKYEY